jgi:hypothetical protein
VESGISGIRNVTYKVSLNRVATRGWRAVVFSGDGVGRPLVSEPALFENVPLRAAAVLVPHVHQSVGWVTRGGVLWPLFVGEELAVLESERKEVNAPPTKQ